MGTAAELTSLATAFGAVAIVVAPAGLGLWLIGRRAGDGRLPAPAADDPVFAVGYLVLFFAHPVAVAVAGQVATSSGGPSAPVQRSALGSLLVAPVLLAGWLAYRRATGAGWTPAQLAKTAAVGVAGWLLASPCVYATNILADLVTRAAGYEPSAHPLVDAGEAVRAVPWLSAASVTVATPFAEEVVFRGLLLGWLLRRPAWAWLPAGLGVVLAGLSTAGSAHKLPAVGLAGVLAVGLLAVGRRPAVTAVWGTSVLFAAAHSNVWPTPLPLFVLGLALGTVTVRTGGVLAGTVLHGLFNGVSLLYLLRS